MCAFAHMPNRPPYLNFVSLLELLTVIKNARGGKFYKFVLFTNTKYYLQSSLKNGNRCDFKSKLLSEIRICVKYKLIRYSEASQFEILIPAKDFDLKSH
jgi:hypothetical protein